MNKKAMEEHKRAVAAILKGRGGGAKGGREQPPLYAFPNLKPEQPAKLAETSDRIPESGAKRDFFFRHLRNGKAEKAETLKEIARRAAEIRNRPHSSRSWADLGNAE